MSFDVSLDEKTMSIVSNRTIFTLTWAKPLSHLIKQHSHKLAFRVSELISEQTKRDRDSPLKPKDSDRYQYDDENDENDDDDDRENL